MSDPAEKEKEEMNASVRLGPVELNLPGEWLKKGIVHHFGTSPEHPNKVWANMIIEESLLSNDPLYLFAEMLGKLPPELKNKDFYLEIRKIASELLLRMGTTLAAVQMPAFKVDEDSLDFRMREDGLFEMSCMACFGSGDDRLRFMMRKEVIYGGPLKFDLDFVAREEDFNSRKELIDAVISTFRPMIDTDDKSLDFIEPVDNDKTPKVNPGRDNQPGVLRSPNDTMMMKARAES